MRVASAHNLMESKDSNVTASSSGSEEPCIKKELIRRLPKAELHVHIEGTLEPEMMFDLARRNNVDIPYESVEELREAYETFECLQDFLDLYFLGMNVLITEQDFFDLTWSYLLRCQQEKVVHTEIFFDPQGHTERGVAFETCLLGIRKALDRAEHELRISSRLIMCFLRHLEEASALETLENAKPFLDHIHGVGLDSTEVGHPPEKFQRVFSLAKERGLRLVAHAGEEGPPEYVHGALDALQVHRVDHGIRSLEDQDLVDRLVEEGIPLTVCPQSNLKLAVVDHMHEHPIRIMLDKGLKATVNSDDPAYFGGYVNYNFMVLVDSLGLEWGEIITLVRNSFEGSFLDKGTIQRHLDLVELTAEILIKESN